MNDIIDFLWERQKDKKKFSFLYENKNRDVKIHYPEGILKIDKNSGKVELLYPNGVYTYVISKMMDFKVVDNSPNAMAYQEQNIKNLPIEDYFSKIVEFLIKKNINNFNDADSLNYSFNKIDEMLNDQKQKKMNKVLFKNYMRNIGAKKINISEQLIILPFVSNNSQKQAICNSLCYDVSVIQGPPGTGKTQTILNIIGNYIFRNKTVCVVSKNNSAVDNIIEKFEQNTQLHDFSIRMGNNKEYIPKLMENYKQKIENCLMQNDNFEKEIQELSIKELYYEIQDLENQYEVLVQKRNLLFEVTAQKRHIDHKLKLYTEDKNSIHINPFFLSPKLLKAEIDYLKYRKDKNGEVNMNMLFKAYMRSRFSTSQIDTSIYTLYQWRLEELYANKIITSLQNQIRDIKSLEIKIKNKYKEYNQLSIDIMNEKLCEKFHKNRDIAEVLLSKADDVEFYQIKKELTDFFPVVVTSLDSLSSNVGYQKFDLVIVDEASQADIITCLPALNISKQIVFVGDSKQLSHIVDDATREYDLKIQKEFAIDNRYCYSKTNALDSIINVFKPPIQLLKEHYRCDYNIINFCNKMYYNNQLIIYSKSSNPNSMQVMSLDKEKNSDTGSRKNGNTSFFNKIEEKAIVKYLESDFEKVSIITPYGLQEENLVGSLPMLKGNIGTIYKFQGRENKQVLVSTVLTHEKDHCEKAEAINDEMLNVAVSRAEEKFILFTHKKFFVEINHNLKYLISYIETYGQKLESNVNSIFSYLFKQVPFVRLENCYDSLWEKKVHQVLLEVIKDYEGFYVVMKTSLADVIINEKYLLIHPEFKDFALSRKTHIDFLIFSELDDKPILAIEVDGKYHKKEIQKARDIKKDKILEDHNIPVWRIKSTDALEVNDIDQRLSGFLKENKWKE